MNVARRLGPRLMLLAWGFAVWAAPHLGAETLTIATYNLENYGVADRMTRDGFRKEYPKPEDDKRALRRVIAQLKADVLVVQEIGGEAYVQELRRDLQREGVSYPYSVVMQGADQERCVAVLSTREPAEVRQHADLSFPYLGGRERVKRGLLEVRFRTEAGELIVFGVHLKSRITDRADDPQSAQRRLGEAVAVRDRILERVPVIDHALVILLGDCNDDRSSAAIGRLVHRGRTDIVQLLPAADARGETWTHAYRREDSYSRIDFIFVSAALRPLVHGGRARIPDGDGVRHASDHRPVLATLDLVAPKK